jgi:hypothetical protein
MHSVAFRRVRGRSSKAWIWLQYKGGDPVDAQLALGYSEC